MKKHFLSKSIFYIIFALCFLGTGIFAVSRTAPVSSAFASTVADEDAGTDNYVPEYFKIQDLTSQTLGQHSDEDTPTPDSLIDYNTFLSFRSTTSNYLKLSFDVGNSENVQGNLYDYCYYPNPNNTTYFNFFTISTINLYINGVEQTQLATTHNFVTGGTEAFQYYNVSPEGFEMYFDRAEQTSLADGKKNTIKITDEQDKVVEGVYRVEINLIKYTCTDGQLDKNEDPESFKIVPEVSEKIVYSFYVLDQDNYLQVNQPIITQKNFDHTISFTDASSENAYYLYSNYSSKNDNIEAANSLPFIEYDHTRYEVTINKTLSDVTTSVKFEYDKDTKEVVANNSDVVNFDLKSDEDNKKTKIYFTDVGDYVVSLQAIYVNENLSQKYVLEGFSAANHKKSKNILVYIYGYQANYTDIDSEKVNGKYPLKELKTYDLKKGVFENSADVTSAFLRSASENSQDNAQTFTPAKIIGFINTLKGPVQTDNTPITFTQNAVLNGEQNSVIASSIYSTRKVSSAYEEEPNLKLGEQTLYKAKFTGLTDIASEAGTYIYILGYSFPDYWSTASDRQPDKMFYQVFYFQIVAEQAKISVQAYNPTTEAFDKLIGSGLFYNQDIKIVDNTQMDDYAYRRDVMIRIYAQEFETKNYLQKFNGANGIDFNTYFANNGNEEEHSVVLKDNAHYTIRLFYRSEVSNRIDFPINLNGAFDEYYFTIDKEGIEAHENITARTVTALAGGSEYQIGEALSSFSSNQSLILSWQNKKSGAQSFAYTRYFPLISEQFYTNNPSNVIQAFLETTDVTALPINRMIDLETKNHTWVDYAGNTSSYKQGNAISGSYVLSSAGLYLVEVYDEAGNRAVRAFFIDNTAPVFALQNKASGQYELVEESKFLQDESTLHWGKNKAIYLANLDSANFDNEPDSVDVSGLSDLFKNCDGNLSLDVYKAFYNLQTLDKPNLANVTTRTATDDTVSSLLNDSYSGWYITIPINEENWYLNGSDWKRTTSGQTSMDIKTDDEANITVLIRDQSNTKFVPASKGSNDLVHYQNYYSARQEIVVSYDTSEFGISFEGYNSNLNSETTYETGEKEYEEIGTRTYKKSYLAPVSLKENFYVSIKPTVTKNGTTTQVETVTMAFYPYQEATASANTITSYNNSTKEFSTDNVTYHYYEIAENATIQEVLYQFGRNEAVEDGQAIPLMINSVNNFTEPGKYEITRIYSLDNSYNYNTDKDFYERTLVFYVDQNRVVTDQTTVTDNDSQTHVEALVGGEVFVGMYDNGKNANLVVTFPDSVNGNKEGQTVYDSTNSINNVLTTNKFPVKLYVPAAKYTKYANIVSVDENIGTYKFQVEENSATQNYTTFTEKELEETSLLISEYALFVEVYNGKEMMTSQLIATSEMDESKLFVRQEVQGRNYIVGINSNAVFNASQEKNGLAKGGFLKLYDPVTGAPINELKDEGTYYIKITQGRFTTGSGDTKYNKNGDLDVTFAMTIEKSNPDFEARLVGSAVPLKSDTVSVNGKQIQNYYTNQRTVNLVWDCGSEYMAEIDINAIEFKTNKPRDNLFYGGPDEEGHERKTPWVNSPELSNTSYIGQISLSNLGIYQNGDYVDITMQYKNHNDEDGYYEKCTKRITVDLSAPHTNIDNLVAASVESGFVADFNENKLRTKQTANNDTALSNDETSYNISRNTGDFAYYSYTVSSDYLNTLKRTTESYEIYYREFGDNEKYNPNNDTTETTYSDFLNSKSAFTTIDKLDSFNANKYYEIVETDRADNLTIYTIYVVDYNERENEDDNKLISYTATRKEGGDEKQVDDAYTIADFTNAKAHNMVHSIYSRPGFSLTGINYFGEAWAQIKLELRNSFGNIYKTTYYMTSPYATQKNVILKFDTAGNSQEVTFDSLFSEISNVSSLYKSILTIHNRQYAFTSQRDESFYFNFQNAQLSYNWPTLESQNEEFVGFTNPSDANLNSTLVAQNFVTHINIYRDSAENGTPLLGADGLTNKLGLSSIWQAINNSNDVSTYVSGNILRFVLNSNFTANTRLVYEFSDNYGTTYSEVRLYKETIITSEVGSENDLYAYYDANFDRNYYVTSDGFQFTYNSQIYSPTVRVLSNQYGVIVYNENADEHPEDGLIKTPTPSGDTAIKTCTYSVNKEKLAKDTTQYYIICEIRVIDTTGRYRRSIFFILYNKLPTINTNDGSTVGSGEYKILDANGTNITEQIRAGEMENSMLSQIRIIYSQPSNDENILVPVKYSISTDGVNFTELSSPTTTLQCPDDVNMQTYYLKIWYDETYLQNSYGGSRYVFGIVPKEGENTAIYRFNLTAQTTTYWVEMETASGETVVIQRDGSEYHTPGTQSQVYTNHYIVKMRYVAGQTAVKVKTNKENLVDVSDPESEDIFYDSDTVTSVRYHITNKKGIGGSSPENIPTVDTYIIITFIPPTSKFVQEFYVDDQTGALNTSKNLVNYTSENIIVNSDNPQTSEITLRWTRYNGIESNLNEITILKDGIKITPDTTLVRETVSTTNTERVFTEVTLKRSGRYTISFTDHAGNEGNEQRFGTGSGQTDVFTLIFLKDVPFILTYNNIETNLPVSTDPINKATYNGTVTLSIDPNTKSYYTESGPQITVERNGREYTVAQSNGNYVFNQSGTYRVKFSATSRLSTVPNVTLREEWYEFTILNEDQYHYSYIFNEFEKYYIKKIMKNDVDMTEAYVQTLNLPKIRVNDKTYLSKLILSYLDEKTGAGTYTITINSNDRSLSNAEWTYKVTIQAGQAPIKISLGQGETTTGNITITYNVANMWNTMGECTVRVVTYSGSTIGVVYSHTITKDNNTGEGRYVLSREGTFFVQVVTGENNDPMFSYKITKKAPMNAATIIAIVLSSIAFVVIVFLIFKLRKRISVK